MPHEVPHLGGRIVAASGDEDLRLFRINQNFIQIAQFIQDVERMWEVSESTPLGFGLPALFGDGSDGDVIISSGTNLASCDIKQYRNLTVAASQTLGTSASSVATMILCVSEVLSVQGTISMDGKGGAPATDYSSSYGASGGGGGGGSSGAGTQGVARILREQLDQLLELAIKQNYVCPLQIGIMYLSHGVLEGVQEELVQDQQEPVAMVEVLLLY
jgi:hypothetical protein